MPKAVSGMRKSNTPEPASFFKMDADSLLISSYLSDTIYCVCDGGKNVFPYYVLNYDGRSANTPHRLKQLESQSEYMQTCKEQNYGSGAMNIIKVGNKLFFSIIGKQDYFVVYDLQENTASLYPDFFQGGIQPSSLVGYDKKHVIFTMPAAMPIAYFAENEPSESELGPVKQLRALDMDEDDNPILVFYKL